MKNSLIYPWLSIWTKTVTTFRYMYIYPNVINIGLLIVFTIGLNFDIDNKFFGMLDIFFEIFLTFSLIKIFKRKSNMKSIVLLLLLTSMPFLLMELIRYLMDFPFFQEAIIVKNNENVDILSAIKELFLPSITILLLIWFFIIFVNLVRYIVRLSKWKSTLFVIIWLIIYIVYVYTVEYMTSKVKEDHTVQKITKVKEQKMLKNFKKKFTPHQLPNTLIELIKFDQSLEENNYYSQSFYLNDDIEEDFFESWLDNDQTDEEKRKEYAKNMIVFARADGTGGAYAMWIQEGNTDLEKAPIISYGSEGEITVVANNLKDLIKMLSFGAEGMEGSFYHALDTDEDEYEEDPSYFYKDFVENRPNFLKFRKWMKEVLAIEPVDIECLKKGECDESEEVDKLVKKAQKKYKKSFDTWQYQFYSDPKEEEKKYQEKQDVLYTKTKTELLSKIVKKPTVKSYLSLAENENLLEDINYKQREKYYKKALEIEPENIELLEKLAESNSYSKPKKAIEYYLTLIEVSNNSKKYYSEVAYEYMTSKKYAKALEFYVKDILENPDGYGDYSQGYVVGICKELKGKDAITVLEETVKKVPNANTYKTLYRLYFKKKEYQKASDNAVKYIEHSDEQAHNYMDIADKFLKKEKYYEALPILKKTIDRHDWDDRKMKAYNDIGLCYLRIKPAQIDKALKAFKKGFKLVPKENAIRQNINLCGGLYLDNKEYDKAIKTFQFCVDNDIVKDRALSNIGSCYVKQENYKKALSYFEKAQKINPTEKKYLENIKSMKKKLEN